MKGSGNEQSIPTLSNNNLNLFMIENVYGNKSSLQNNGNDSVESLSYYSFTS